MSARRLGLCLLLAAAACARTGFEPPTPPSGSEADLGPELNFGAAAQEVAEGAGSASLSLVLSSPSPVDVSVPYAVGGSATPGSDHDLSDGVTVIPAGQTSHTISFSVNDDADFEPGEYILVTLGVPQYAHRGAHSAHTITLLDDDPTPALSFIDSALAAFEESGAVALRVQLSAVTPFDVTVNYSLSGSADGDDYRDVSGAVLIPAGAREGSLRFDIIDDELYEPNESVQVTLGAPANALLGAPALAVITIVDNDAVPPQLGLTASRSCAVVDGSMRCWGYDHCGDMGVDLLPGDLEYSSTALTATLLPTGTVTSVATGNYHTCAVVDGGAFCLGDGEYGQLGRGEGVGEAGAPIGLERGVHMVASGGNSSCAVHDGALSCWGSNDQGNLGTGDLARRWQPTAISGLAQGVTMVAVTNTHSCAIKDSALQCWGSNWAGQLGVGGSDDHLLPAPVPALQSGVTWVAVAEDRTCAVADGAAFCWGYNGSGEIGDGSTDWSDLPQPVQGLGSGVSAIALAGAHSCAVVSGGVRCWGGNNHGQLGDGSFADRLVPAQTILPAAGLEIVDVAASPVHTCALGADDSVRCWGWGGAGQLGDGLPHHVELPAPVTGLSTLSSLSSSGGARASCGVSGAGAFCWGSNDNGQLGDDSTLTDRGEPVAVSGLGPGVSLVIPGWSHSCALVNGGVRCWGAGWYGELGDGQRSGSTTPVTPAGLDSGVDELAVGGVHSCAIAAGTVYCWGGNWAGQLGLGNFDVQDTPQPVAGLPGLATAIAAADEHTCAVAGGAIYCWGAAGNGRLGNNSDSGEQSTPVAVQGLPAGNIVDLTLGVRHTCAVVDGTVYCWGYDEANNVWIDPSPRLTAVEVAGLPVGAALSIAAGAAHTCAVVNGELHCWGGGALGQLGVGDTAGRRQPTLVSALQSEVLVEVTAGDRHTCARSLDRVWCWGSCDSGQTGSGCLVVSADPVVVTGF